MNKRQKDKFEKKINKKTFKEMKNVIGLQFLFGFLWDAKNKEFRRTRDKMYKEFMTNVHIYADDEEKINQIRDEYERLLETHHAIPNKFLGCRIYRDRSKSRPIKR